MDRKPCHSLRIMFLFNLCTLNTVVLSFQPPSEESAEGKGAAIEQVAKQNIPAVVYIEVTERQEVANPLYPFENDPFSQEGIQIVSAKSARTRS